MSDSDGSYNEASSPESEEVSQLRSSAGGGGMNTRSTRRSNAELRSTTGGGYIWEDSIQRPWDIVQEDEGGSLATAIADLVQSNKRKRLFYEQTPLQRGIIRHLILVLDLSSAMADKDMRPSRYQLSLQYAVQFVNEYFEQNPISQLGVIGMKDGIAHLISQLGGNPAEHITAIQALRKDEPAGVPSLQNALEMARGALYHVPSHGTKEVVIIFGALLSCDPGDIHKTISTLKTERIRVRVVGLAAQVAVCKELCKQTNDGDFLSTYGVILNEQHFKELLLSACTPPASTKTEKSAKGKSASELMRMGFPSRIVETTPSFCACHTRLLKGGYLCPRCNVKVCSLPTECPACGLVLILSTHLARSYHHLMPLRNWYEVEWPEARRSKASSCFGCHKPFAPVPPTISSSGSSTKIRISTTSSGSTATVSHQDKSTANHTSAAGPTGSTGRFRCPTCHRQFCIDCDLFAHEVLHNCPGCEATSPVSRRQNVSSSTKTAAAAAPVSSTLTTAPVQV